MSDLSRTESDASGDGAANTLAELVGGHIAATIRVSFLPLLAAVGGLSQKPGLKRHWSQRSHPLRRLGDRQPLSPVPTDQYGSAVNSGRSPATGTLAPLDG